MFTYMNTTSFEMSKELFERSGWTGTEKYWYKNWLNQNRWQIGHLGEAEEENYPAYDLGYLLRKLPPLGYKDDDPIADSWLTLELAGGKWFCGHKGWRDTIEADTPEDAACILAIRLFEQDVLKGE